MKRHYAGTKVNKKIKNLSLTSKTQCLQNEGCNSRTKYMPERHMQGVMERLYFLLQREKVGSSYWRTWKKHMPR